MKPDFDSKEFRDEVKKIADAEISSGEAQLARLKAEPDKPGNAARIKFLELVLGNSKAQRKAL